MNMDYIHELYLPGGEQLEVIYQTKLVGLVVESSLSWWPHVEYTIGNANKKLCFLIPKIQKTRCNPAAAPYSVSSEDKMLTGICSSYVSWVLNR